MSTEIIDIIDRLVGITAGSVLDQIRAERLAARENAQKSYDALFHQDSASVSRLERLAVAAFVTGLHRDAGVAGHYAAALASADTDGALAEAVAHEIAAGAAHGPYGAYPAGPLAGESVAGPEYRVDASRRDRLGSKLTAALEHAHFLVFHPRDATPDRLQTLLAAGWDTTGIVTLSQLVAFLSFQIRVVAGLKTLKAAV